MWAPADLFTPGVGIFLLPLKQAASYFHEHLIVLALTLVAVALLITAVTVFQNRRARGT